MSDQPETLPTTHTYKPAGWWVAYHLFNLLIVIMVFALPVAILALVAAPLMEVKSASETLAFPTILILSFLYLFVALLGFSLVQQFLFTIGTLFSYIKVSPDGIEQRSPLLKHIRCKWSDIDQIGKFFIFYDALYLNHYEIIGPSLSLKIPWRSIYLKKDFIQLTGFRGWSDGQLANDIRQYAPQLFIEQETSASTQPASVHQPAGSATLALSDEARLLAALSHASVIFTTAGIFFPLVIYAIQKQKSAYVAVHALQAFIWQMLGALTLLLSSFCMTGGILVPIFMGVLSQSEEMSVAVSGGMLVAIFGSMFLMLVSTFVFFIYGIVGAILTYQGKDFRYPLIGKRIEKSSGGKSANINTPPAA